MRRLVIRTGIGIKVHDIALLIIPEHLFAYSNVSDP